MALLYVQGTCPPPEIREVVKEVEVFRTLPPSIVQMPPEKTAEPIEEACEGGNIIMINPFYTGEGNWGGDLAFNYKVTRDLGLGLGVFYQPGKNKNFITNIQHDEYTVGDRDMIGETNLISSGKMDIKGVMANMLIGRPCKVRLGLEGGIGWANYQLKNSFEQTVKDASTGELIDKFVCNGGSLDVKKMIYRAGGMLVMPLSKDKAYIFLGGGVMGNLPEKADIHFSTGNINQAITIGPKTDWYAKIGFGFDL
jgi:hypothetical protein